jgi:hypothetical protein
MLLEKMNKLNSEGDWKDIFKSMMFMEKLFKKAGQDCHHAPGPHDVCKKDLHMLGADFHKMWKSAKQHDSKAMKAELEFMLKDNTEIQTACHLHGACMEDSKALDSIATAMMKANESGDWKGIFKGLMGMKKLFHKAGQDCHHSPQPEMKCRRDIRMLQKDLHMMMDSAKKQDLEHLEKEVKFLEGGLPTMETDCEMKGMCKKDFDALEGMVTRMESVVEAKDWKKTD